VPLVVQDLHLRTGVPWAIGVLGGPVDHAAVPSFRDTPVVAELEISELVPGNQIAAIVGGDEGEHAILGLPTGRRGVALVSAPLVEVVAVEEDLPALCLFCGGEGVGAFRF